MFFETHVRIAPQDLRGSCDRLVNLAALKDRMFLFFFLVVRYWTIQFLRAFNFSPPPPCLVEATFPSDLMDNFLYAAFDSRSKIFSPPRIIDATGQSRQLSRVFQKLELVFLKEIANSFSSSSLPTVTDSNLSSTTRQRKVRVDGFYSTRETVANHFHTVNRTLPKSFDW